MSPPTEGARAAGSVIQLAVAHPMRAWVDALETLLEPRWDIDVVAAHTNCEWVRHAVLTGRADSLLTFVDTPASGLLARLADLFEANTALSVVGLSDSQDRHLLSTAVRAGVRGWVEPTASVDHLVRVLHGVAAGETWFPPRLMTPVLDALLDAKDTREQATAVLSSLSAREVEVLQCLAQGLTRQEIADRYFLSPHTVRTHINNLLHKLDVHSTLAAVSVARQLGLPDGLVRQRNP